MEHGKILTERGYRCYGERDKNRPLGGYILWQKKIGENVINVKEWYNPASGIVFEVESSFECIEDYWAQVNFYAFPTDELFTRLTHIEQKLMAAFNMWSRKAKVEYDRT